MWDDNTRSYMGVLITSHYKDPYEPISIMERQPRVLNVAHVANVPSSKQPALLHPGRLTAFEPKNPPSKRRFIFQTCMTLGSKPA